MKKLISSVLLIMILPAYSHAWQKGVLISPLRIVLDSKKRFASVKIVNPSKTPTRYRIELVSMDMDENGRQYESKSPDRYSEQALKIVKFSPKSVSLQPNGLQTIRLMKRIPKDLETGEYRTHLKVTPMPPPPDSSKENSNGNGIKIDLNFLISSTIPIIIRHGETFASINIESVSLKKDSLIVSMSRVGTRSALFDIIVESDGKVTGKRERVAFYCPNKRLLMPVKIETPEKKDLVIKLVDRESEENFIFDVKKLHL